MAHEPTAPTIPGRKSSTVQAREAHCSTSLRFTPTKQTPRSYKRAGRLFAQQCLSSTTARLRQEFHGVDSLTVELDSEMQVNASRIAAAAGIKGAAHVPDQVT